MILCTKVIDMAVFVLNSVIISGLIFCSFSSPVNMAEENQTVVINENQTVTESQTTLTSPTNDKALDFADIDKLLEGDDENKTKAYGLLEDLLTKVSTFW